MISAILAVATVLPVVQALPPDAPIEGKDVNQWIGVGMDVDWGKYANESNHAYSPKKLAILKHYGYDHIRIRTQEQGYDSSPSFILHVEKIINDTLAIGMIPIVAVTGDKYKDDPSDKNLKKFVKLWKHLAEQWQDYTHKLIFDIMIEPSHGVQGDTLNEMFEQVGATIRKTNPTRLLTVAPGGHASPRDVDKLKVPESYGSKYWFLEAHMFASGPQQDTSSQGYWPAQDKTIKLIQKAKQWADDHNTVWWWAATHQQNHETPPWPVGEECLDFVRFIMKQYHNGNGTWCLGWEQPEDFWAAPGLNGTDWKNPLQEQVQAIITSRQ